MYLSLTLLALTAAALSAPLDPADSGEAPFRSQSTLGFVFCTAGPRLMAGGGGKQLQTARKKSVFLRRMGENRGSGKWKCLCPPPSWIHPWYLVQSVSYFSGVVKFGYVFVLCGRIGQQAHEDTSGSPFCTALNCFLPQWFRRVRPRARGNTAANLATNLPV